MSKIDLVLATVADPNPGDTGPVKFTVEHHTKGSEQAGKLLDALPAVTTRLQQIIDADGFPHGGSGGVQLEEVEFHLGIEGGLSIGLSAKAEAAITLKFKISPR